MQRPADGGALARKNASAGGHGGETENRFAGSALPSMSLTKRVGGWRHELARFSGDLDYLVGLDRNRLVGLPCRFAGAGGNLLAKLPAHQSAGCSNLEMFEHGRRINRCIV